MISKCREKCPERFGLWVCGKACEARPGDPNHFHFNGTGTSTHDWKKAAISELTAEA